VADLASKATLPPPLLSLSVFKIVDIVVLLQNNGYVRLLLTKHCNQNLSQAKNLEIQCNHQMIPLFMLATAVAVLQPFALWLRTFSVCG
jgi:hypothetical protein